MFLYQPPLPSQKSEELLLLFHYLVTSPKILPELNWAILSHFMVFGASSIASPEIVEILEILCHPHLYHWLTTNSFDHLRFCLSYVQHNAESEKEDLACGMSLVIFFSLTEPLLPDPTLTPPNTPRLARSCLKRTELDRNGLETDRNGSDWACFKLSGVVCSSQTRSVQTRSDAETRKCAQKSAKKAQKSANFTERKERKRAQKCKNGKQPGLKQPGLGTPKVGRGGGWLSGLGGVVRAKEHH